MIRFHPSLYIAIVILLMTGNIAVYAMLLISLYVHEIGHLCFAKLMNEKIASCKLTPYGGEIEFSSPYHLTPKSLFFISIGGPIFTILLLIGLLFIPLPVMELMIQLQLLILGINLLPFLPLDGGQVVYAILEHKKGILFAQKLMYRSSIGFFIVLTIGLSFYLPNTMLYILLTIFLFTQNFRRYQQLRYENAIRKIIRRKPYKIYNNC